jgi:hypothetical protein
MTTPPVRTSKELPREATPPAPKQTQVPPGIGAASSSISPIHNAVAPPVADNTVFEPVPLIPIETRGFLGRYTREVPLDTALENQMITPQQALQGGLCTEAYLTSKGYFNVLFQYGILGRIYNYQGTLREALKRQIITIEEAIRVGLITRKQAIEGGLLKEEPLPKEKNS